MEEVAVEVGNRGRRLLDVVEVELPARVLPDGCENSPPGTSALSISIRQRMISFSGRCVNTDCASA